MGSTVKKSPSPILHPERWVDEHGDLLFRYAYIRTGDRDAAEDLVQETLLAGLEGGEHFEGRCSVQTWLVSILRHKISAYLRQRQRNPIQSSEIDYGNYDFFESGKWKEMPGKWFAKPEEEASKKEFWDVFIRCISYLSSGLADAFILREIEWMDPGEICSQLHISDTGLWSRLHRARLNLRHCLEKNWFHKPEKE